MRSPEHVVEFVNKVHKELFNRAGVGLSMVRGKPNPANIVTNLLATFEKAFGDETEKSKTSAGAVRKKYQDVFNGAVDRP